MPIEDEIKTTKFSSEIQKAHLNILFSAYWVRNCINTSLRPFALTTEQYNVLRIVRGKHPEGIRVKDITVRMLERNSNTTRIIDRLVVKGLLTRQTAERDGRERLILLTGKGAELLASVDTHWHEHSPHKAPKLSEEETVMLNLLLDKMRIS
jgi:DNA-binding MarR family transcriptional regulator